MNAPEVKVVEVPPPDTLTVTYGHLDDKPLVVTTGERLELELLVEHRRAGLPRIVLQSLTHVRKQPARPPVPAARHGAVLLWWRR